MTNLLAICFLVLQGCLTWSGTQGFCFLPCPRSAPRYTLCAVDPARGAKLFHGKCQLIKENHCNLANYKRLDIMDCLRRYPQVVTDFMAANQVVTRFEAAKGTYGMRPLPRFTLLGNVVVRMAEVRPWPIPLMPTFGVYQLPFPMWPPLN